MPSASSAAKAFGPNWMPAPISPSCGACSSTLTEKPRRTKASATATPPMPPPATSTGRDAEDVFMGCPVSGNLTVCTDTQYTDDKCRGTILACDRDKPLRRICDDDEGAHRQAGGPSRA